MSTNEDFKERWSDVIPYKTFWEELDALLSNAFDQGQQEHIKHLEHALQTTLYQCVYWLKTYRSHTGSMNATHISEQESLERAIKIAKDALSETTQT